MKAAFFASARQITLSEVPPPAIGEDEVLLRIEAAAVCATDLKIFNSGYFRIPPGSRRVLGHELAGVIVEAGRLASGYRPGMRVVVAPNIGCGSCELCRKGYNQLCLANEILGITIDGAFQEYMRVPAMAVRGGNIFALPDHLTCAEAALIEPLSCCYSAFSRLGIGHDDAVLVLGAGPIGTCHVMLARMAAARQVIVADIRDERLAAIAKFGADATINAAACDLKAAIMRLTQGRGVDVAITAASVASLQTLALELMATHGRVCFFGGLSQQALVPLDTNLVHYRGLTLLGTTGSSNADFYQTLRLVADGRVPIRALISQTFALSDINAAFDYALSGQGMKTVVAAA